MARRAGVSSGQALEIMEQIAREELPGDYGFEWAGEAREEKLAGGTSAIAFIFGLIFVFLILAAQYESWSLPFGVIMAVPFALLGALLAIVLRGIPNDVYFQIGMLTLIALAAKNAILIVEFAVDLHKQGKPLYEAAVEAARLRFRPILMTSFAFILGVVPLAIATGASANSRHSIGTGVIGGMLGATAIAVFFIPMFFLVLERLGEKFSGKKSPAGGEQAGKTGGGAMAPGGTPCPRDPAGGRLRCALPDGYSLCFALAGCSLAPKYLRPPVDSPDKWRVDYADAADTANLRWWELFDDPVLNGLIDTALKENKDVRLAAARVEEFAARVDIFRAGYFPQIGYDGEASRNRGSREAFGGGAVDERKYNNYAATANLSWELDLWGRIRGATEAARAELLAQEENRRTVILSLVSAVATSYVTLRQLDRQLEVSKETLATRAECLRLFELKLKAGVVSDLEVAMVRTEYEQAAAAIPPLERQIALTENALSILLGENPRAISRGKGIDALVLPPVPEGVPSSLLARRPDIRSAEQALIAANARIGVARAQYFPTISLTGLFGYASESLSDLLQDSANVWSFGGSALGPIFTGGRISAEVRASEAVAAPGPSRLSADDSGRLPRGG